MDISSNYDGSTKCRVEVNREIDEILTKGES